MEKKKKKKQRVSHQAIANCAVMTRGRNYFLTHVITGVQMAVRNSFTLSLVVSIDFMAGRSAAAALAQTE